MTDPDSRAPAWNILIATLGQRTSRLERLLFEDLLPQLNWWGGLVQVTALYNNGERPLGAVRQDLIEYSQASYVSFVDDDDRLPRYHVDRVMNAILDYNGESGTQVDYVGWRMQCYLDGQALKPTYHSLRYSGWFDDDNAYYRDVSHLNPIRRELALRADFRRGTPPEDVSWVDQMRPHVKTEVYLDDVMYHYHSSASDSTWRGDVRPGQYQRLVVDHPYFEYHPGSSE